jgi:hypothetical protein
VEITRDTGLLVPLLTATGVAAVVTEYLEGMFSKWAAPRPPLPLPLDPGLPRCKAVCMSAPAARSSAPATHTSSSGGWP